MNERKSKRKSFQKQVDEQLKIAMAEIGEVTPWFDKRYKAWIFEHSLYPESYSGDSPEEVIKNYPLYIRQFIEHRMNGTLAPYIEAETRGRGGARLGAGRPPGRIKPITKTVRLPEDIVYWLKESPENIELVRKLMLS